MADAKATEASAPAKETAAEAMARLKRVEATTGRSGAIPLSPKQHMLDASMSQQANPDKHLRWLNLRHPEKIITRQAEGYVRLSEAEGGRSLGDEMALFAVPREMAEQKRARLAKMNNERIHQHTREMEREAESMARMLRDKYGKSVSAEQLLNTISGADGARE